MKKVLQIESGISTSTSHTRSLSKEFITSWKTSHPEDVVIIRDVLNPMIPHLDQTTVAGFFSSPEQHTPDMKSAVRFSDDLVQEILDTDIIVVGAPVYNLGIPSTLKAYFDHIARAGKTFRYTENGPEGLLKAETAYILTARGGFADPQQNFHEGYLKQIFQFLGVNDVRFFHAEGLAIDDQSKETALKRTTAAIRNMLAA